MKFRIVFWDVLPCRIIVDNYSTRQYIPEDNSELQRVAFGWVGVCVCVRVRACVHACMKERYYKFYLHAKVRA